ncbi:ATP-dependent Clp protease ATP-binding subunit [Candidatus Uhrbacteria bacterium]|nr:ATP-dependent Clp protease ATP-binding subunit [Candidatus Uhrbacteria bacterium]
MPTLHIQLEGKRYAWSAEMDEAHVHARAASLSASHLLSALVFSFLIVSLLGGMVLAYVAGLDHLFSWSFWFEPSWAAFLLHLGLFSGVFLYAHQSQIGKLAAKMPMWSQSVPEIEPFSEGGERVNLADLCSADATAAIKRAFELARKFGHKQVEPLHLFVGTMDAQDVSVVFGRLGLSFQDIQAPMARRLETRELGKPPVLAPEGERVILEAFRGALVEKRSEISSLEVFAAVYEVDAYVRELLLDKGIDEGKFRNMIVWLRIHERMRERYKAFRHAALYKPTGAMNRAMTSVATPMLDAVSEDLTTAAVSGQLPLMIDRDIQIEEIFRVIEGGRQSVVLVGPEGVGKSTVLAGIAELMVKEEVPKILQDRRLVRISIPHLVSGADAAQAQERLITVLSEAARSRNIILAFTDIDQLVGQGADASDLAATLVDFLSRSGTFAVATTTPQVYASIVERSVLGREFQKVDILEPDQESAIHMLESKIGGIEYEHHVIFSYQAVERAVKLSDRYMHETYLPKKAIEVAREVALQVSKSRGQDAVVTGEDVAQIVSAKTGIPTMSVAEDEKEKLLGLEENMHGRVIGQEEAVKAVASALRRARTELRSQTRPIATFLFLGPTGVGKTELAKTVAATYFGSEDMMVRLDMSEYQDASSINRLLGTPGSQLGGLLTEAVRKQPFAIVLLDELEKAHPDILNVFLQVFDDGRLTDSTGRTIDFTNTIIICTSNAGTPYIQDAVGRAESLEVIKTHLVEEELRGIYRPEFLNRFDGIIVFKPLAQADVLEITKLFMKAVALRLEPKGIGFRAEEAAVAELATKGFDPKFGARPLRRLVQEEVDSAIANALLQGEVRRRDTIVLEAGGKIRIEKGEML